MNRHDGSSSSSSSSSNNNSDLYVKLKPYFISTDQLEHIIQLIGNINVNNDDSVGIDDDDDNYVINDDTHRHHESRTTDVIQTADQDDDMAHSSIAHRYGMIFEAKPGCGKSSILEAIRSVLGSECSYIDCAGPISENRYIILSISR